MKAGIFPLLLLLLSTCNKCRYADCPTKFDGIQFNYVTRTGKDLLSGTWKKYEANDIAMFAFDDEGKRIYAQTTVNFDKARPSTVVVLLPSDHETYLEVHKTVTDTLRFEFEPHPSECCGTYAQLTKVFLNNRKICDNNELFEIKER